MRFWSVRDGWRLPRRPAGSFQIIIVKRFSGIAQTPGNAIYIC
jgi:hypothetical protein